MVDYEAMKTFVDFVQRREEVKQRLERQPVFGDRIVKDYIRKLSEDYYHNPVLRQILIEVNGENANVGVDSQGRYFHKDYGKPLTQKQSYCLSLAVEEARLASQFNIEECLRDVETWKNFFSEEFTERISGEYEESNPEIKLFQGYTFDPDMDRGPKYQVPKQEELFSDYSEKPQVVRNEDSGEWEITNVKPSPADRPIEKIAERTAPFRTKENPRLALQIFD